MIQMELAMPKQYDEDCCRAYCTGRQRTGEHLDRIREGRVETITQNGQAAMIVMSPERYDFLVHSAERGHLWREAIRAHRAVNALASLRDICSHQLTARTSHANIS